MSDVMLLGVLNMPYEMAMQEEMSRRQFHSCAQEAADLIGQQQRELDELRKANEWQQMDTAPRDGAQIWACWTNQNGTFQGVIYWCAVDETWADYYYPFQQNMVFGWKPLIDPPLPHRHKPQA